MPGKVENNSINLYKKYNPADFPAGKEHHNDNLDKEAGAVATAGGGGAGAIRAAQLKKASTILKKVPLFAADQFTFRGAEQAAHQLEEIIAKTKNPTEEFRKLPGDIVMICDQVGMATKTEAKILAAQVKKGEINKQQVREQLRQVKQKDLDDNKNVFDKLPKIKVPQFDAKKHPFAVKKGKMALIGAAAGLALYGAAELVLPEHHEN
jgi:hypothetical protein